MGKTYPERRPQNGSIAVCYSHKGERKYFFIGKVIKVPKSKQEGEYWVILKDPITEKPVKETARASEKVPDYVEINEAIERKMKLIKRFVRELEEEERDPTATLIWQKHKEWEEVREQATKELESGVLAKKLGHNQLFGFWEGIVGGEIKPRNGRDLSKASASVKRQTMRVVKEFDPLARFEKMDMAWYNRFVNWMDHETIKVKLLDGTTEKKKRFDTNTIGKHVRQLKAVLHLAYRNELMLNDRFRYWPVPKEPNEVITLNKEELLAINEVEIPAGTKDDVRDLFVIASFFGLRISDYKALKKENLSIEAGVMFFSYIQEKTGALVKIPVHPIVQKILAKRNGEFPRMIAEQNFREYLREICKDAKLNDRVVVRIRDRKPEYKKKWEAISPHSARRTFASALFYGWFTKPMPASFCMRYTGHKTEKSFMLYIGAKEKDLDERALEYFDLQPVMKVS